MSFLFGGGDTPEPVVSTEPIPTIDNSEEVRQAKLKEEAALKKKKGFIGGIKNSGGATGLDPLETAEKKTGVILG